MMARPPCLVLGLGLGIGLVAALHVVLPSGWWSTALLGNAIWTLQASLWVLLGVGLGDAFFRWTRTRAEVSMLGRGLLPEDDRVILEPGHMAPLLTRARALPDGTHMVDVIQRCILHYQSSGSISDTHDLLRSMTDLRMHRVDLDYALLRYLTWLVPTVGFIGTVHGIAHALAALKVGDGAPDLSAVLDPLSTAFYSTFVALIVSAGLMLVYQSVQRREEQAVGDAARYCLLNLVNRLHAPQPTR